MATHSKKSSAPVLSGSSSFRRSGPFCNSTMMASDASSPFKSASSSSFASSTTYHSSSASTGFFSHRRSASPTRVNLHALSPTPSVRFSIDRSISPRRSISAAPRSQVVQKSGGGSIQKRTCMCSPTNHPGSFRCALHKNSFGGRGGGGGNQNQSVPYSPNRLNMRRSAMTNSLVRIGTVEGDLMRRALAALIRPSSHQQRRRADFRPRSSRLSVMTKAGGL